MEVDKVDDKVTGMVADRVGDEKKKKKGACKKEEKNGYAIT